MAFDPTTNRVPFGLLEQHERIALTKWPHGWEWYDNDKEVWREFQRETIWHALIIYRGKPAPREDV